LLIFTRYIFQPQNHLRRNFRQSAIERSHGVHPGVDKSHPPRPGADRRLRQTGRKTRPSGEQGAGASSAPRSQRHFGHRGLPGGLQRLRLRGHRGEIQQKRRAAPTRQRRPPPLPHLARRRRLHGLGHGFPQESRTLAGQEFHLRGVHHSNQQLLLRLQKGLKILAKKPTIKYLKLANYLDSIRNERFRLYANEKINRKLLHRDIGFQKELQHYYSKNNETLNNEGRDMYHFWKLYTTSCKIILHFWNPCH